MSTSKNRVTKADVPRCFDSSVGSIFMGFNHSVPSKNHNKKTVNPTTWSFISGFRWLCFPCPQAGQPETM